MNTRLLAPALALLLAALTLPAVAAPIAATVHKSPYCGCCQEYIDYLKKNGFAVKAVNHENMLTVQKRLGTNQAASCHTVEVGGYVVEGHVPVASIHKLLKEKPKNLKGIALPGMPLNSPGMGPEKKGSLKMVALDKQGKPTGIYDVR